MILAPLPCLGLLLYHDIYSAPFHPQIHNLGNTGFGGAAHARLASAATTVIDHLAYDGRNMRREVAENIARTRPEARVVDVGCGVGTLTRELVNANLTVVAGIDTSYEMIAQANHEVPGQEFLCLNAAHLSTHFSNLDVAVACMLVHELPEAAHSVLINAMLQATHACGQIWIVDIAPSYTPSPMMLSGEPYLQEYMKTFEETLGQIVATNSLDMQMFTLIDKRVKVYVIAKQN